MITSGIIGPCTRSLLYLGIGRLGRSGTLRGLSLWAFGPRSPTIQPQRSPSGNSEEVVPATFQGMRLEVPEKRYDSLGPELKVLWLLGSDHEHFTDLLQFCRWLLAVQLSVLGCCCARLKRSLAAHRGSLRRFFAAARDDLSRLNRDE